MKKDFYDYKRYISLDIETTNNEGSGSLNAREGDIALIQCKIFDKEKNESGPAILIYPENDQDINHLSKLLTDSDNLVIIHNYNFEYLWLAQKGIFIDEVLDTLILGELYYSGLTSPDEASKKTNSIKRLYKNEDDEFLFDNIIDLVGYKDTKSSQMSFSLQTSLLRELNIFISKEAQNSDWKKRPLTAEQIKYAKSDVEHLYQLAKKLWDKAVKFNLQNTIKLEMGLLPAAISMSWTGSKIHKESWLKHIKEEEVNLIKLKDELELEFGKLLPDTGQSALFSEFEEKRVNLNSSVVIPKILGLPNVKAQTLLENVGKNEYIPKFLSYKKLQKEVSTYGEGYFKYVLEDERLRTTFVQTFTSTGRFSSRKPNCQNLVSWFKGMVRSEENYIPVIVDYSQIELRIMAYAAQDEAFIEACNSTDMHTQNARNMYKIPENESVPSELRRRAKTLSFSVPYGISPVGLVGRGIFPTFEEADEAIKKFYEAFPKVAEFLQKSAEEAVTQGWNADA